MTTPYASFSNRTTLRPVTYLGWAGLKNGELLRAAEDGGFDVFLTGDQTLVHVPLIRENVAKIVTAIGSAVPGSFQFVECGTFSRRKPPAQS